MPALLPRSRRLAALALVAACVLPAGCHRRPTYRASLDDAHGLEAGAPAFAAGVRVGTVRAVKVVGDKAVVRFEVSKGNHLTFHADACALAMPIRDQGSLYLRLGTKGSLARGAALPQCDLVPRSVRQAVGQVGQALKGAIDRITRQVAPPAPCPEVSVRLIGTDALPPGPGETQGHVRVRLEIDNGSETEVSFPAGDEAGFLDGSDRPLARDPDPDADGWFMPFTVPAHGKRAVAVAFTDAGAKPATLVVDLGYGVLQTCRLEATLKGR